MQLTVGVLPSFTRVNTWVNGLPGLLCALTAVFGDTVPQRIGKTTRTEFGLLARSGPQEFLLVGDDATDRSKLLRITVDTDTGSVTDLSNARCRIRIEGTQCRRVLNKLFALDLHESALGTCDIAITGSQHAPSTLHRLGAHAFDLYVFSSHAHEQLGTVLEAAQEYGVALQPG